MARLGNLKRPTMVVQMIAFFLGLILISSSLVTFSVLHFEQRVKEQQLRESLSELSSGKAQVLAERMQEVNNAAEDLSILMRAHLSSDVYTPAKGVYERGPTGILSKVPSSPGDYNVYLPVHIDLTPTIQKEISGSENMIPMATRILERNQSIQWIYMITKNGLMCIVPYANNDSWAGTHDQREDVFFRIASPEENPNREAVWTQPYYDYLGTGWMVTCSVPIYDGDEFLGIMCADVRIDAINNDILKDFRLGKTGFAFLISGDGGVIYHPDYMPASARQGKELMEQIDRTAKGETYSTIIGDMLENKNGVSGYYNKEKGTQCFIAYAPVPVLGWAIGIELEKSDGESIINGIAFSRVLTPLLIMAFAAIFLAIYLLKYYSTPLLRMVEKIRGMSEAEFALVEVDSNFPEIKSLGESFNTMSMKLKGYTDELLHKSNQLQGVFDAIEGSLLIVDRQFNVRMSNRNHFRTEASFTQDEPLFYSDFAADAGYHRKILETVFKDGRMGSGQSSKENDIFRHEYYPIFNGEGRVEEVVVYSRNITKETVMEKELLQTEKMAGIGKLSSAIVHEIKTPLAVMRGAVYALGAYTKEADNPLIHENLRIINSNIDHAETTIYTLLDFSKVSGPEMSPTDVTGIVEQILLLENKNLIRRGIDVTLKFDPSPFIIFAHAEALKHVLQNLIGNAVEAMSEAKEGQLIISGCFCEDSMRISVKDTGKGILKEDYNKIFDPFYTTKQEGNNIGIGLWLTKMIVKKMGGQLLVESAPGEGSEFTVILPARKGDRYYELCQ